MIICLCGKSNSGKGYVSNLLTEIDDNIIHLDIDKVAHHVNDKKCVINELVDTFGECILEDNKINRKKLGNIVFADLEEMKKLENITWKHMEEEIDCFIDDNKDKIILLDYIMLPRTKYFKDNLKILVDAPLEIRMNRALIRDGITKEYFEKREANSPVYNYKDFDYVINNIDKSLTKRKVVDIYDKSIISR